LLEEQWRGDQQQAVAASSLTAFSSAVSCHPHQFTKMKKRMKFGPSLVHYAKKGGSSLQSV
jgi:ABC-type uncharacterized transport system substrate-binding protein